MKEPLPNFDQLTSEQRTRVLWIVQHPPAPRTLGSIPQDVTFVCLWGDLKPWSPTEKIFPPRKVYVRGCRIFGIRPHPKWVPGIPGDVLQDFRSFAKPLSTEATFQALYRISHYDPEAKMRISEPSTGLLQKLTGYGKSTTTEALDFLRSKRFIRRLWRGRPNPKNPRHRHSGYELSYNQDHVLKWRIHPHT